MSKIHTIQAYSGKEQALKGQRLVTITFKKEKETGIKPDNQCVSIPKVADSFGAEIYTSWNLVEKHVFEFFEEVQDRLIREKIVMGKKEIPENELGLPACLEYLNALAVSGRLSGEALKEWFKEEVEPFLATVLCEKLGVVNSSPTREQEKIIEATLKRFESWVISMAGTKTLFSVEIIDQIEKCFKLCSSSQLLEKLQAKLVDMRKQHENFAGGLAL